MGLGRDAGWGAPCFACSSGLPSALPPCPGSNPDPGTKNPSLVPSSLPVPDEFPSSFQPAFLSGPGPHPAADLPQESCSGWEQGQCVGRGKDTLSPPLYPTLPFGKQRAWVPRPGRLVAGQSEKQKILHNPRPLYMLATQPLIRHSLWGELTWGREAGAAKGRGRHWKARMLTPESPGRGGRGSLPLRLGSLCQQGNRVSWLPGPHGRGTHSHRHRV